MRYLIVAWAHGDAAREGDALCQSIMAHTPWRPAGDFGAVRVFAEGRPPPAQRLGGAVVVGRIHPRGSGHPPRSNRRAPDSVARDLTAEAWGRYVAVVTDEGGRPLIFNDPVGGQECLVWRKGAVVLASSEVPCHEALRPPGLAIDWSVLALHLPNISLAPEAAPLTGVASVGPGCLYDPATGIQTRLWSPAAVVRGAPREPFSAAGLREVVEDTVAKLALGRRRVICDISGGLDSAIVASALARTTAFSGYHQRFAEAEADESAFAAQVAALHGAAMTVISREPLTWSAELIEATADGARPASNAIDSVFDRQLAAHLRDEGADALFTGHGGDAVFFQHPDAGLFMEALFGRRGDVSRLTAAGNVAYRLRRSFFSLLCEGLNPRRQPAETQRPAWLVEAERLPSARRTQIKGLIYARHRFGRALRAREADLVDPLIAQPVVEWCLQAPLMALAGGDIDRTLAREAFSASLPPRIATRARKGDLSVFFGKSLLQSRSFLRDYLLGGRLREEGLLDAGPIEVALQPQTLLWRNVMGEVLAPLAAEAWVRVTEENLRRTQLR